MNTASRMRWNGNGKVTEKTETFGIMSQQRKVYIVIIRHCREILKCKDIDSMVLVLFLMLIIQ